MQLIRKAFQTTYFYYYTLLTKYYTASESLSVEESTRMMRLKLSTYWRRTEFVLGAFAFAYLFTTPPAAWSSVWSSKTPIDSALIRDRCRTLGAHEETHVNGEKFVTHSNIFKDSDLRMTKNTRGSVKKQFDSEDETSLDDEEQKLEEEMKMREANGPPIVWIDGIGRSGSTLMRVILDADGHMKCGPESRVLSELLNFVRLQLNAGFIDVNQSFGLSS